MPRTVDLARTTYLLIPGFDSIANHRKPTVAELTAATVVNITPQTVQTTEIGAKPSDTTDERAVNATGNAKTPTVQNYDGQLNMFRELDADGNPVLTGSTGSDLDPLKLLPDVGVELWIVKRTGPAWDAAVEEGQSVETYFFITDVPIPSGGKQDGFLKLMTTLLPQGYSCTNAVVQPSA